MHLVGYISEKSARYSESVPISPISLVSENTVPGLSLGVVCVSVCLERRQQKKTGKVNEIYVETGESASQTVKNGFRISGASGENGRNAKKRRKVPSKRVKLTKHYNRWTQQLS